jgi:hypothetical protein
MSEVIPKFCHHVPNLFLEGKLNIFHCMFYGSKSRTDWYRENMVNAGLGGRVDDPLSMQLLHRCEV